MVKKIKKHGAECISYYLKCKQTYVAAIYLSFSGCVPVSPVAVYITMDELMCIYPLKRFTECLHVIVSNCSAIDGICS
jgi:hypothetical protein